jgi:hypothetical protein
VSVRHRVRGADDAGQGGHVHQLLAGRFWPLADLDSVLIHSEPTSAIGKSGYSARPTVRFTLRTGH